MILRSMAFKGMTHVSFLILEFVLSMAIGVLTHAFFTFFAFERTDPFVIFRSVAAGDMTIATGHYYTDFERTVILGFVQLMAVESMIHSCFRFFVVERTDSLTLLRSSAVKSMTHASFSSSGIEQTDCFRIRSINDN